MMKMISTILVLSLALVACKNASTEDSGTKGKEEMASEKEVETSSKNDNAAKGPDSPKEADEPKETAKEAPKEVAAKSYAPTPKAAGWKAPDTIKVQHILVGVKGSRLPKPNLPTEAEAKKLAESLCDRVRAGEDMGKLVVEFSADGAPGIYSMTESGRPNHGSLLFGRREMAQYFGDVSYKLDVGECAIANYEPSKSPFGFHIIKRLE